MATRTDKRVDRASTVEPGDAPADTTDPSERVTSVTPDKAAAAAAGHQTVNAVVPLRIPDTVGGGEEGKPRTETYDAVRPDGVKVSVTRNVETGETKVSEAKK